ncbi:MAG: UvrB/UvrC motif-containing protein, partial [Clostridiaceae bacterium]
ETFRRRKIQEEYNIKYNITPQTIIKDVRNIIEPMQLENIETKFDSLEEAMDADKSNKEELIEKYEIEMRKAAKNLEFENAAKIRDMLYKLKKSIKE